MSSESQADVSTITLESGTRPKIHSKNYQVILGILKILVGLALLFLSFREIQLDHLWTGIRSANLTWLGLAVFLVLLGLGLKLLRWAILVKNYRLQVPFSRLFSAYFVGQATNIILPLRSGELVRLGYFAENKEILPEAASTILLEKYLDLLALTASALIVSYKISLDNILDLHGVLLPITVFITLLFLAAILLGPTIWLKLSQHQLLPTSLINWLDRWVQVSQWMLHPLQVLPGVLLTLFIWVVMWLTNIFLFKSLGLSLDGVAAGLVLVLVYLGLLPALMPGNVGPFYFFASLALVPFGIMHEQALIFAVILHAIVTLPPLIGGAAGLFMRTSRPLTQ